jgi:hypothetical protein
VSKIIGKSEPEPGNRKTGKPKTKKPGTWFQFWFEKFKNRVPRFLYLGFWYPVFTGKPGTGVPILFNNIYILLKLYIIILGT